MAESKTRKIIKGKMKDWGLFQLLFCDDYGHLYYPARPVVYESRKLAEEAVTVRNARIEAIGDEQCGFWFVEKVGEQGVKIGK